MPNNGTTTYPGTIDAFLSFAGTSTYEDNASYAHDNLHNQSQAADIAVENTLGTTGGTSVLKNFVAGNFAARTNNETFGTPTINGGTANNLVLSNYCFNALDYGTTNTDVEIQAALDAVNTAGGGAVYVPAGTWLLSASLKVYDDTMFFGDGFSTIIKQANGKNLPYLIRGPNSVFENHYRIIVANLQIDGNYANQTHPNPWDGGFNSAGILADAWNDSIFYNLLIKNCGIYGGLCTYGYNVDIINVTVRDTQATASGQYASGILIDSVQSVNTRLHNVRVIDVEGKGIYMEDHPSQISLDTCEISGGREGIVSDATEITDLKIKNCTVRDTNANYGIDLGGSTTEYDISGCHVFNNFWHGMYILGGNGVISGNVVYNNSKGTAGVYHGIVVGNSDIAVYGNRCFDNQGTKTQQYGIHIPSGCLRNTAVANTCTGNNSTGVQNDGGTTNKVDLNT